MTTSTSRRKAKQKKSDGSPKVHRSRNYPGRKKSSAATTMNSVFGPIQKQKGPVVSRAVGPNHRSKHKIHAALKPKTRLDKSTRRNHKADDAKIPIRNVKTNHKFRLHMPREDEPSYSRNMPWSSSRRQVVGDNPQQQQQQHSVDAAATGSVDEDFAFKRRRQDGSTESKRSKTNPKLPTSHFDEDVLSRLDHELHSFVAYVRLTPLEQAARDYLIQHVTDLAGTLFSASQQQQQHCSKKRRRQEQRDDTSTPDIVVQTFGSYATPDVCTFASDVDMALWGVVPSTHHHVSFVVSKAEEKKSSSGQNAAAIQYNDDDDKNEDDWKPRSAHDVQHTKKPTSKEERLQKWRDVLAQVAHDTATAAGGDNFEVANKSGADEEKKNDGKNSSNHNVSKDTDDSDDCKREGSLLNVLLGSVDSSKNDDDGVDDGRRQSSRTPETLPYTTGQETNDKSQLQSASAVGDDGLFVIDREGVVHEFGGETKNDTGAADMNHAVLSSKKEASPEADHNSSNNNNNNNNNNEVVVEATSEQEPQESSCGDDLCPSSDALFVIDRVGETELNCSDEDMRTDKEVDGGSRSDSHPSTDLLFVIDRVGDTDVNCSEEEMRTDREVDGGSKSTDERVTDATISKAKETDSNGYSPSSSRLQGLDGGSHPNQNLVEESENSSNQRKKAVANKSEPGTSKDKPLVVDGSDSSPAVVDLCSDSENDSDNDSADKLEAFRDNKSSGLRKLAAQEVDQQALFAEKKRRTISLSSSTSSNSGERHYYNWQEFLCDESGMEVSFVSHSQTAASRVQRQQQMVGPKGQTKKLVVNALQSLGRKLRQSSLTHTVEVRKNARVPIICMATYLGIEGDIAVGGHNGTDTSQFASMQAHRFRSFAPVVIVLKVLLNQQGLDKPFTGGLGSYKLYVLVAHHLERHLALGGRDRPSEVLLSFFFRYGGMEHHPDIDTSAGTEISQKVTLRSEGGSADLEPVFNLEHCRRLFYICWTRLVLRSDEDIEGASLLGNLVNANNLRHHREDCLRKAGLLKNYDRLNKAPTTIGGDHSGKVCVGKRISHVFTKPALHENTSNKRPRSAQTASGTSDISDDEANQLIGNGLKSGQKPKKSSSLTTKRFGCPECGKRHSRWTQCMNHMKECCSHQLLNKKGLMQRCTVGHAKCIVPGTGAASVNQNEPIKAAHDRIEQSKNAQQKSHIIMKPVLHDNGADDKEPNKSPSPTTKQYGCPECGELQGRWSQCLNHMKECCSHQLEKKKGLMGRCRRLAIAPVQRGPRGALIPRHRPDVEARNAAIQAHPESELVGRARKNRKNKRKQNRDEAVTEFANRFP